MSKNGSDHLLKFERKYPDYLLESLDEEDLEIKRKSISFPRKKRYFNKCSHVEKKSDKKHLNRKISSNERSRRTRRKNSPSACTNEEYSDGNALSKENTCLNEVKLSPSDKWLISLILGGLFALLSLPFAYYFTSLFIHALGGDHLIYYRSINIPSVIGVIIHSIIYVLIVRGFLEIQF